MYRSRCVPPQHFIGQREEFETARDGILVWLTEMDLQLTNIEHFSECDIQAKIKQLRVKALVSTLGDFNVQQNDEVVVPSGYTTRAYRL